VKIEIGHRGAIGKIAKCPHCSSSEGYFRKPKVTGMTETNYSFDGSDAENGELHTPLAYVQQKTLYCQECRESIGIAK
jgi:hypothetical protein